MVVTRLIAPTDAEAIATVLRRNREQMADVEPVRPDAYFTTKGQFAIIQAALERHANGTSIPRVVMDADGRVVGRVNINEIVRGPSMRGVLGYFVDRDCAGRGLATAAVGEAVHVAFARFGLHRIEAGVKVGNDASIRVLEKNGFTQFGVARDYLRLAGHWHDHVLYERIAPDR